MFVRILIENKNYSNVVKLVGKYFADATIIKAEGLWQGKIEHSLVIEILINGDMIYFNKEESYFEDTSDVAKLSKLAYEIKQLNQQDAVMVQYLQCQSKLI